METLAYWKKETQKYQTPHLRLLRIVEEIRQHKQHGRVLDIGCGPQTLGSMLGTAYEYYGVDVVGTGDAHFQAFDFEQHSLTEFPFKETFDIVTCSGLLEYLSLAKIEELLKLIHSTLLTQESLFVATYTNFAHVTRRRGKMHPKWITKISINEIQELYRRSGFEIQASYPSYYKIGGGPLKPGLWWNLQRHLPLPKSGWFASLFGKQYIFVLKKKD